MFHLNHAVKISKFCSVVIASPDTDVFVCILHHFSQLACFSLNKFWVASRRSNSLTVVAIHDLVEKMTADIIEILPAVHLLTGWDTASKIGTKVATLKTANVCGYEHLCFFGKHELTNKLMYNAKQFLLRCIQNEKVDSFDDLRYDVYQQKLHEFYLEKFPGTSSAIKQHILYAYLQCHLWLHAPFIEDISIDTLQYGHSLNEEDGLVPLIISDTLIPGDFSSPCNCLKCARPQGCSGRIKQTGMQLILQMRGETILQKYSKLLFYYVERSVYIGHFLSILSKNVYTYLGKI